MALQLLALPREIGLHPETGKPIKAGFGRFGPYIAHEGAYASLDSPEDVFSVGINRAVTLLAERKTKGGSFGRGGQALKELGPHPETKAQIKVMKGRYGPYVSDGKLNATLPRDSDPMSVNLDEAVALLAERAARGPAEKKRPAKKAKASEDVRTKKKPAKAAARVPNGESKPKRKPKRAAQN